MIESYQVCQAELTFARRWRGCVLVGGYRLRNRVFLRIS